MFEGILGYIIGGALIGVVARFVKPGADPMGWIMTIVLGIAGAAIGGYLYPNHGMITWAVAIGAAVVLLFLFEMLRKKKAKA
jgi:uncharacterized membrane protein YeaQ/YmgE (transglycosylase-associated protein family)